MAKPYWQIILLTLIILLALNVFAMWQTIGVETLAKVVNGQYRPFGLPANPFSDILRTVLVILLLLCAFIWAVLSVWNKAASRQSSVKRGMALIAAISIAGATTTASYYIDGTWSGTFRDSPMIGFPISPFVFTNMLLIFISVSLVVFLVLSRIVRNKQHT